MFDKNRYKEMFRRYAFANRHVNEDDALEYCRQLMPPHMMASHYWLVESCMQWFRWIKTQKTEGSLLESEAGDSEDGKLVC